MIHFKFWKPDIPIQTTIPSCRNWLRNWSSPWKRPAKELRTTKPVPQRVLEGILQMEEKDKHVYFIHQCSLEEQEDWISQYVWIITTEDTWSGWTRRWKLKPRNPNSWDGGNSRSYVHLNSVELLRKSGRMAHAYSPGEAEAGGYQGKGHPLFHSEILSQKKKGGIVYQRDVSSFLAFLVAIPILSKNISFCLFLIY